ncbi:hypothetical protein ATI02_4327 [Pseudomonas baetica]|uniref:Uncharacterized protein n=1 Tax=Pseudomonas baetica TaxID=674054 RepID=A0ABX4Q3I2_9PSED|nr:hypothetical protein [Pseudomonas baetica]PKA71349.1 hypothetical protein ATI02_4327 [Pseudomonas baetica]PTC19848.1 hypothetical protein C0J26_07575 [Pseudomonas baetica]
MTTDVKSNKASYEENKHLYSVQVNEVGAKIIEVLTTKGIATDYEETLKQITAASEAGDVAKILELTTKLKSIKDNRANHEKALSDFKQKFKFPDILQAYREEFEELAYQAAQEAVKAAHVATNTKGKRGSKAAASGEPKGTRTMSIYQISKGDKSVEFPLRAGPAGLEQDRAAFEFLGFKLVTPAGATKPVLEPAEITYDNGTKVPAARKSIIEALNKGGVKKFKDYDVKDVTPKA